MLEIRQEYQNNIEKLCLTGRIDGITSPDLDKAVEKLISEGKRRIVIDLGNVSYISSVGLRVFLSNQKILRKISGELILFSIPDSVYQVFSISGFTNVFTIIKDFEELQKLFITNETLTYEIVNNEINGVKVEYLKIDEKKNRIESFGNYTKLNKAEYELSDVVEADSKSIRFALGLGAIGNIGEDLVDYFGETLVINNNIFVYPAQKSSKVDFILEQEQEPNQKISFLNGFGTAGKMSTLMVIKEQEKLISLNEIIEVLSSISESQMFGVVFLGISGGILGMNLKRVPVSKNSSEDDIFNKSRFSDWFDYPVDSQFANNIISGFGIAVKDKTKVNDDYLLHFSQNSKIHIHTAIFEKDYLSNDINEFEKEIKRVTNELNVIKVQHIMGNSLFKSGFFGIIEPEL